LTIIVYSYLYGWLYTGCRLYGLRCYEMLKKALENENNTES